MNIGTRHIGNSLPWGEFLPWPSALVDQLRKGSAITRAAFEKHRSKKGEAACCFGPKKKRRRRRHPVHPRNGRTASQSWLRCLMVVLAATCVYQADGAAKPKTEPSHGLVCQITRYQEESCRPGPARSVRIRDKDQTYDNSYTAVWEAPLGIVTSYELYRRKSGESSRRIYRGSSRQHHERSLSPGTYYYKVRACNINGCNRFSSEERVEVAIPLPDRGSSITLTGKSNNLDNSYDLAWGASNGTVTHYELHRWWSPPRSQDDDDYLPNAGFTFGRNASRNHRETGITHGRWRYRVRACNSSGCGEFGPARVVWVYPHLPGPGSSVTLTGKSNDQDNSYSLAWGTSTGVVTHYALEIWKAPQGSQGDDDYRRIGTFSEGVRRNYQETGMHSGRYKYIVRACNSSGCGEDGPSLPVRVFLPRGPTPSVADKDNNQDRSYTLKWPSVGGVVTRHKLHRWKAPLNTTGDNGYADQGVVYEGSANSKTETNMPLGRYKYQMSACDPGRCEQLGSVVPVLVYPPVPGRGAQPYVNTSDQSDAHDGTYTVRWNASSGMVDHYELEEQTSPSVSWIRIYKGPGRSHDQNVGAGDRRYRVRACNVAGCGGRGDTSSTTYVVPRRVTTGTVVTLNAITVRNAQTGTGPLTYRWSKLCGPDVTLTNANSAQATFTAETYDSDENDNVPNQPSGVGEFAVYTTFTFQRTVTNAQGNEVDTDKVTVTATPNVTQAPSFDPSSTLVGRCASDPRYTAADEKNWLRSWILEEYLWYNEVVDHGTTIGDYSTETYFDLMKTFAEATSCGQPKDRFHYISKPISSESSASLQTRTSETRIGAEFISSHSPDSIYVEFIHPNSPAASVTLTNSAGNPMPTIGLMRGDRVTEVDGTRVDSSSLDRLSRVLYKKPSTANETRVLKIVRPGTAGTLTASITITSYEIDPVPLYKVIEVGAEKVGYLLFVAHIKEAEAKLIEAINAFDRENINDLVLDLRYNRGGHLYISNGLATMIANSSRTRGQTYARLIHNNKRPDSDRPFKSTRVRSSSSDDPGTEGTEGDPLPILGLDRLFVLTYGDTCSASEAIINGLRGVDIEVIQIGVTTCGKPYGFHRKTNCGTTYSAINFKAVNDAGFGDYQHGFAPRSGSRPNENTQILPGCWVEAVSLSNPLGNKNETFFATALAYRRNSGTSCATSITSRGRGLTELRATYEPIVRELPPWGGMIVEQP